MKTKSNEMEIPDIIWRGTTEPKVYYLKKKENRSRDKGVGKTNNLRSGKGSTTTDTVERKR